MLVPVPVVDVILAASLMIRWAFLETGRAPANFK